MSRILMRRQVCQILAGAALTTSSPAQERPKSPSQRRPRIGVMWHAKDAHEEGPFLAAFLQGLEQHGYVDGRTVELHHRFADETRDRYKPMAEELIALDVDVIVSSVAAAAVAARQVTKTTPIVGVTVADYLLLGLAESLARPGGNVTGSSLGYVDLAPKLFEICREGFPLATRAVLLANPFNVFAPTVTDSYAKAAAQKEFTFATVEVTRADALDDALAKAQGQSADLVFAMPDAMLVNSREDLARNAIRRRLPLIGAFIEQVRAGAILAYSVDVKEMFRRSANFVDRILKGARPGDMPIEQAVRYLLAVNQRTAKALSVSLPPLLVSRADEVIEPL